MTQTDYTQRLRTRGNRTAYLNVAEYALGKVIDLLRHDGVGDPALKKALDAYELVFEIREADGRHA